MPLLSPSQYRELISGRRRGPVAAALRLGLRLAEVPYTWAVRWRNRRYDTGAAEIRRVQVPVISVGNLTLGGTGKTPMVEWLARWFRGQDTRVTVISRGYKAEAGAQNDEALELEQKLPDVPHLQNPDRVAAAEVAVEELQCELILLDDAFQHRRMGRDLDIVLIDALEPFGFGHVFPRGTLREPIGGLRRADAVALSRADMLEPSQREEIWQVVRRYSPGAACLEVTHAARALVCASGRETPLDSLADGPIAAFCGIGNPAGFRHTLRQGNYQVEDFREFPDHHNYNRADVESLASWANRLDVDAVVCTYKDLVKLGVDHLGRRPLWAVVIGLDVLAGQDRLEARLLPLLPG
ncbi:MAG: tetraacyldisaccharide 4'-kinase [Pirellulales bacterium]|nr:tetraacyldisaccharide 4'-kinase [Pirellulales bacterium]